MLKWPCCKLGAGVWIPSLRSFVFQHSSHALNCFTGSAQQRGCRQPRVTRSRRAGCLLPLLRSRAAANPVRTEHPQRQVAFLCSPGQLGLGRWGWGPCPDQWLDTQTRGFPITGNLCRRLEGEGLSMSHGEVTKLVTGTAS